MSVNLSSEVARGLEVCWSPCINVGDPHSSSVHLYLSRSRVPGP